MPQPQTWIWAMTTSAATWAFLMMSGVATGLSWVCYFRALKLREASRVAPIDKLSVPLVALLGWLILGEQLGAKGWLGVGLMLAGAALLIAPK